MTEMNKAAGYGLRRNRSGEIVNKYGETGSRSGGTGSRLRDRQRIFVGETQSSVLEHQRKERTTCFMMLWRDRRLEIGDEHRLDARGRRRT